MELGLFILDTLKDTLLAMSCTYLVHRHPGQSFLYRSIIPRDLQPLLGQKQFQLSLCCGILSHAKLISQQLYHHTQKIYAQIRHNSDQLELTLQQIKHRLRIELDKLNQPFSVPTPSQPPEFPHHTTESKPKKATTTITLSELSSRFLRAKTEAGYPLKTVNGYQDTHKLLLEVIGNLPLDSISHQQARDFIQVLKRLPVNRSKSYANWSIKELLKYEHQQLLSPKTILKHTERISALFNWAINQGYTSQNVFRGKLEPIRKVENVEKHFTDQELNLILGDALKTESIEQNKPERYWVAMLSAYSGARLNEVCQLNVSDIQKTDGIWLMNLSSDSEDKSIKTEAGNRSVPIHPKLLELEFLSYVEQIRNANHKKLFPNLKKMLSTGYGTLISRWFAKYLKELGIKKRGKNFHSFRHTVVNKLITKKVYEPFIKELIGHSHGSITMDVYGGKKPLYVLLNECVIKI